MSEKIHILQEEFENEKTGEKVAGVTFLIDGKLKQIMDIIIANSRYKNYPDLIHAAFLRGMEQIMHEDPFDMI